jgi:hypothetical protein
MRVFFQVLVLLGLLLGGRAWAGVAGSVSLLTGRATALAATGSLRDLRKGDSVFSGDILVSGANSYLNLKFKDGSAMLLRPNTRFQIEQFSYNGSPASTTEATETAQPEQKAFFRLLKGGFRAVSGAVGKVNRDEYRISTPVATIGIRGTDYTVTLCDAALCSGDPAFADVLPAGAVPENGLVVGVISGGVFVANANNASNPTGALVEAGKYLLALPDGTQVVVPVEPRFLKIDPLPSPSVCD